MKFRVCRQIITHHKVSQVTPVRAASDALRVLIVSDPSETLKNVSQESEQLCGILDQIPGLQVRLLGGRGVRRIPLLAGLRDSDIVHFAGHSQFDEKNPENSGWLLYDGLLSASEISKLDQAPLLVFSNSCQAGATKNWQGDYLFEGQAFGLGSAFLLAGVRNYVGTFCVVHDEESRFLAVEFYRRIARGKSIGQALLEARVATAEEMGLDRLTWASYMLYGDPSLTLPLETKEEHEMVQPPTGEGSSRRERRTSVSSSPPEEQKRWQFRWPRFRLSISISITAALAVVLLFSFFMNQREEKVAPTSIPPESRIEPKPDLSVKPVAPVPEIVLKKPPEMGPELKTPQRPPGEKARSAQEIDEEMKSTLTSVAAAEWVYFLEAARYTNHIVDLIQAGLQPTPGVDLNIDYADANRFIVTARKAGGTAPSWTYDSTTGKITRGR
jgi:hypothetical protein